MSIDRLFMMEWMAEVVVSGSEEVRVVVSAETTAAPTERTSYRWLATRRRTACSRRSRAERA